MVRIESDATLLGMGKPDVKGIVEVPTTTAKLPKEYRVPSTVIGSPSCVTACPPKEKTRGAPGFESNVGRKNAR